MIRSTLLRNTVLALLLAAPLAHANDDAEVFGADMPDGDAVALDSALASFDPASAADTDLRKFSGRIVDVCEKRGCWAMLEADGVSARVMPREHDFMVPRDARGTAVVYGKLSAVDLTEAKDDYGKENPGKPNPIPDQEYRIDALSVVLVQQDG